MRRCENPGLGKRHRACSRAPRPGCLHLLAAARIRGWGDLVSWGGWGGARHPLVRPHRPPGLRGPGRCPPGGSDCMKLFTSDYAVYKRDVGWVGGSSQVSGGLGNVLSAPACSKATAASLVRVSRGPPGRLRSVGRTAEVALPWRG